jgi:hypothetical protein
MALNRSVDKLSLEIQQTERPAPPSQPPSSPQPRTKDDQHAQLPEPAGNQPKDESNEPPHLNIAQRIADGAVKTLEVLSAVIAGTAVAVDEGWETVPVPGDYPVIALSTIGAKEALQALRALSRREHPLDYLFLEGSGSFAKGLAMEVGKKAAAAIPPVIFALGASYGRDALFQFATSGQQQNEALITALYFFDTAIMRSLLIGIPALLLYKLSESLIEQYFPGMQPPDMPPIDNPDTTWYQNLLGEGLTIVNSMAVAGMLRQIFNTFGPAIFLHSPYAMLMAPIAALTILPLAHYIGEELHPLQSVRDFFAPPQPKTKPIVLDDANGLKPSEEQKSAGRIAINITTKLAVTAGVFALAGVVNNYATAAVSTKYGEGNDPGAWSSFDRIWYEAALTAGVLMTQRLIENLPAAVYTVKEKGPIVVKSVKENTPEVMMRFGNSIADAASTTASSISRAARSTGEYFKTSLHGMFGPSSDAHQGVIKTNPSRIDLTELDFDFPDENVILDNQFTI